MSTLEKQPLPDDQRTPFVEATLTTPEVEGDRGSVPSSNLTTSSHAVRESKSIPHLHTEEAHAKSAATKKARSERINFKQLVRRRRNPEEIPTLICAVQNFCRECMGWDADGCGSLAAAIDECTCKECWLYPWRNGKVEFPESEKERTPASNGGERKLT